MINSIKLLRNVVKISKSMWHMVQCNTSSNLKGEVAGLLNIRAELVLWLALADILGIDSWKTVKIVTRGIYLFYTENILACGLFGNLQCSFRSIEEIILGLRNLIRIVQSLEKK